MNSLAFIASVVGSLAVPVTIVVVLVLFRGPLTELLGRIISYEGLGQKVNFGRKLAGAEKSASKAVAQAQESEGQTQLSVAGAENIVSDSALLKITSAEQNPHDVDLQRAGLVELAEMATSNPSFVVIKAWEDLQATLRELAKVALPEARHPYGRRLLADLVNNGYVDESFARAVQDFQGLRDDVAHGKHNPTAGEAVTYLESTRDLAAIARNNAAYIAGRRAAEKATAEAFAERSRVSVQSDRASK
jgi:hypothetical protein